MFNIAEEAWVHWDLNPHYWTGVEKTPEHGVHLINGYKVKNQGVLITENNDVVDFKGFDKVQGLVALQDSREEDGGFCCVRDFNKLSKNGQSHVRYIVELILYLLKMMRKLKIDSQKFQLENPMKHPCQLYPKNSLIYPFLLLILRSNY